MKSNTSLKKYLISVFLITIIFLFFFAHLFCIQYQTYMTNYNLKLDAIITKVHDRYPKISKNEIIDILNSKDSNQNSFSTEYGIDINIDSLVLKNDELFKKYFYLDIFLIFIFLIVLVIIFLLYDHHKNKKIREITDLIDQINHQNYILDFTDNEENSLSILQNELYKTTIMLKEQAENEKRAKDELKRSLEDISHQLKTPLTSISIMLDNLLDNPNMDELTRNDFMTSIKRDINNINFLIISLLKLSKFDTNTIELNNDLLKIDEIVSESIKNVAALCDLQKINISVKKDKRATMIGDYFWQVEAITNILKNAIEHSPQNSTISISYEKNKAYSKIVIKDEGEGISKSDQRHIFERFYKRKNSSNNNFGIGLALAKSIIEKNNGLIKVESKKDVGTSFIIKYFN